MIVNALRRNGVRRCVDSRHFNSHFGLLQNAQYATAEGVEKKRARRQPITTQN